MNEMKNLLRRQRAILKLLDPDDFYIISSGHGIVQLQGDFKRELISKILKLKFKQTPLNDNGWINFTRGKYEITLT
jgi:hypothetical protein